MKFAKAKFVYLHCKKNIRKFNTTMKFTQTKFLYLHCKKNIRKFDTTTMKFT